MTIRREPLAGRIASPLRSGALWGLLALVATGILALIIGGGGAAITWVAERFDAAEYGWPGDLVFGAAVVGVALSIPAATWSVSYASTQAAPAGRALLATGLGIGSLVAIATVDRGMSLLGGAGMAFAVALPFGPWHRLAFRIIPVVLVIVLGAAFINGDGNPLIVALTAVSYPMAALLVWVGDAAWRWLPLDRPS
jgi:hypothetical protein